MLPGPTSESSAVVSPIQEIPMPLPEGVLWSESMFDPHPGQAGSSAWLPSINEADKLVNK